MHSGCEAGGGKGKVRLLTVPERKAYLKLVKRAESRVQAAGARIPDDGLDDWGNVKEPS
jgi:hypothetical protein